MTTEAFQMGRTDGSTVSRAAVVAEGREWLGTKFVHQHSFKQAACDCGGLMRGIALELGLAQLNRVYLLPEKLVAHSGQPDGVILQRACDEYLRRVAIADAQPGDMILIKFGRNPQHLALLGDYRHGGLSMIHALGPGGPGKVVEHNLDESWRRRIVAVYAIPGVE